MSAGEGLLGQAGRFRGMGLLWLVDRAGAIHIMNLRAYALLTAAQLEGAHVFLQADTAERFARAARPRG